MMNIPQQPVLTLFAGINGAGKSTLYILQQERYPADRGVRVCPDEILVENDGDWQVYKDVWESGRIAYQKIEDCINQRESFNWEFTVISNYVVKIMERAKAAGYQIRLNFILTDDVEMALQRIENRVKNGGHGIPEDVVRSRFNRQLANMAEALSLVDMAVFYDNIDQLSVVGLHTQETPLEFFDKDTELTRKLLDIVHKDNTNTKKL